MANTTPPALAVLPAGGPPATAVDTGEGCLARLAAGLMSLSGVRRAVAEKILHDPWSAQGQSINALAAWAGVSENAISRLTLSLGYSGYREFAQSLSMDLGKSLGYYHVHPEDIVEESETLEDGALGLVRRVVGLEIACLQDTLANLSEPTLHRVVDSMVRANHILVLGTGTAAPLSHMLTYRLTSVGIAASWTNDPMMMLAEVNRLHEGDLVLAITYSGRSRDTVQATAFAAGRGIATIAVTANPSSPVGDVADDVLTIFSPNISEARAQFSARVAGLGLLEAIATAVAVERNGGTGVTGLEELGAAQDRLNTLPDGWTPPRRKKRRTKR